MKYFPFLHPWYRITWCWMWVALTTLLSYLPPVRNFIDSRQVFNNNNINNNKTAGLISRFVVECARSMYVLKTAECNFLKCLLICQWRLFLLQKIAESLHSKSMRTVILSVSIVFCLNKSWDFLGGFFQNSLWIEASPEMWTQYLPACWPMHHQGQLGTMLTLEINTRATDCSKHAN